MDLEKRDRERMPALVRTLKTAFGAEKAISLLANECAGQTALEGCRATLEKTYRESAGLQSEFSSLEAFMAYMQHEYDKELSKVESTLTQAVHL